MILIKRLERALKAGSCGRFITKAVLCAVLMLAAFTLLDMPANAADQAMPVAVSIEGNAEYSRSAGAQLINGRTYVPFRAFCEAIYNCGIEWHGESKTAYAYGDNIVLSATEGENYIVANGRYFYFDGMPVYISGDRTYVPLRITAEAFGSEVGWNGEYMTAYVGRATEPIEDASSYYDEDELYWLSRIIYAESGSEPLIGMIAVGNVVLNRVRSDIAPDTIYGVIFDNKYGVQFEPTSNGAIYQTPSEKAVIAAKICLEGYSISEDILFFYAPRYVYAAWIEENRTHEFTIGGHKFFS